MAVDYIDQKTIPEYCRRGIVPPFRRTKETMDMLKTSRHNPFLSLRIAVCNDPAMIHNHRRSEQAGFTFGRRTTKTNQLIEKLKRLSLPALLIATSKLPSTQCPVIPRGKICTYYVAFQKNFQLLCVSCTQTPAVRSVWFASSLSEQCTIKTGVSKAASLHRTSSTA